MLNTLGVSVRNVHEKRGHMMKVVALYFIGGCLIFAFGVGVSCMFFNHYEVVPREKGNAPSLSVLAQQEGKRPAKVLQEAAEVAMRQARGVTESLGVEDVGTATTLVAKSAEITFEMSEAFIVRSPHNKAVDIIVPGVSAHNVVFYDNSGWNLVRVSLEGEVMERREGLSDSELVDAIDHLWE